MNIKAFSEVISLSLRIESRRCGAWYAIEMTSEIHRSRQCLGGASVGSLTLGPTQL